MQLAWDFDALGLEPTPGADRFACITGRNDIHLVANCGHCEFCGKPCFTQILAELAHLCAGHEATA